MDPYRNKVLVGVALFLLFISSENLFATTGVLLEDFNSCQIPVDWEVMDLLEHEGGSCGWQWRLNEGLEVNKTGGGDEGCFILANSDECGLGTNIDTVLVTPSLDCLDLTGISLSFKYDAFEGQGTSTFAVEISTDGGSNWVPVWQQAQSDRGPKTASVDISSEADGQPSVLIRFRYNASWDWWWQIDDVTVISNEKNRLTGSCSYRQLPLAQTQPCNDRALISIRDQGALDLIRFLLDQGRDVCIQVSGDSMRPFLHGGETIRVSPLAGQIPKIGEILFLCDSQGSPLVHRLVRRRFCKGNTYLQTKGDACLGFDGFVPSEQVLGRVRQIISHSENDLERIKSLGTFFMRLRALMVVGLSLIFYYLRRAGIIMKIRGDS